MNKKLTENLQVFVGRLFLGRGPWLNHPLGATAHDVPPGIAASCSRSMGPRQDVLTYGAKVGSGFSLIRKKHAQVKLDESLPAKNESYVNET